MPCMSESVCMCERTFCERVFAKPKPTNKQQLEEKTNQNMDFMQYESVRDCK